MPKKKFDIRDFCDDEYIIRKVDELGEKSLTPTSHNFEKTGSIKIIDAAYNSYYTCFEQAKNLPAISLIEVVLAANRSYNKHVLPNINRIKENYPNLISFSDLKAIITHSSPEEFYKFWGHRNKKKYTILKEILAVIDKINADNPQLFDYELMKHWGSKVILTII